MLVVDGTIEGLDHHVISRRAAVKVIGAGALGLLPGCQVAGLANTDPATTANGKRGIGAATVKQLRILNRSPLSAEPALDDLARSFITSVDRFFIRNHGPIPQIDMGSYVLSVGGDVPNAQTFTLDQLRTDFKKTSIVATLTCAGNRRAEYNRIERVGGVQWGAGATGTARWTGVRLADLLRRTGVRRNSRHVWFEGLDETRPDRELVRFGASIPMSVVYRAKTAQPDVLLAYEMNGKPLTPEHGFPLRAVVPGYIGARSVKWLGRIVVSADPSDNHYMTRDFKLVTNDSNAAWSDAASLSGYLLNSVICEPKAGATLRPGLVTVRGYALPPGLGDLRVHTVELSIDGGNSWRPAALRSHDAPQCWRLWEAKVPVRLSTTSLIVRAHDTAGAAQPSGLQWNHHGYQNNSWHEIPITVV